MTDNALVIASTVLLILLLFNCRILIQLKRRYRSIDIRLSNNNEWVLMNYKSVSESLEKMNETILNSYPGGRIVAINKRADTADKDRKKPNIPVNREQRVSPQYREEMPEHISSNNLQQYYSSILGELQQLNKVISQQQEQEYGYDYDYDRMYNSKL
jgi:hypothetical protein